MQNKPENPFHETIPFLASSVRLISLDSHFQSDSVTRKPGGRYLSGKGIGDILKRKTTFTKGFVY
jgi:hypothetical protein